MSSDEESGSKAAALAASLAQVDIERLPPRPVVAGERRPRWCARNAVLLSPHQLIDGRIIRSALLLNRHRKRRRSLRFPQDEVASYLESDNPWKHRKDIKRDAVLVAYKEACTKNKVSPLQGIIYQIKSIAKIEDRCEELNFQSLTLRKNDCEALEEVFKRILFFKINLDSAIGEDVSAEVLFQIFEFYEATTHLDLSNNQMIATYGWQACSRMLRKTQSLKQLDVKNVHLNEEFMTILIRGLRYSYLIVLKLESCNLSGRLLELLVIALKFNMALRQLYLCDNGLHGSDCIQIETLLKFNSRLAFLDLSNNNIDDDNLYYVMNGLTHQLHFGKNSKSKKGLESLVLWNNKLTRRSATHINAAIKGSNTLKYLNLGSNDLTDDAVVDTTNSLMENKILHRLELQSTEITCYGVSELSRVLQTNNIIKCIDLRNNPIYKLGLLSLIEAMKINKNITEIIVDEKSKIKVANKIKVKYSELVKQLQDLCERNKQYEKEKESVANNACANTHLDEDSDERGDDSIFEEDGFDELEEPQEELPSQYKRYMTWKI